MIGRDHYTRADLEAGRNLAETQLSAHSALVDAIESEAPDGTIATTLEDFNPVFFNALALALDRLYGTRGRENTDSGALGELDLIADSLSSRNGVFTAPAGATYDSAHSHSGLSEGNRIALSADQFERLANAVFAELEKKLSERP